MRKIFTLMVLLILVIPLHAQQPKKVAVFDPEGSVMRSIRHIVREEISNAIVNSKNYDVVERSMINKVLEEARFQAEGLVDDSELSELGRMMGADYVCYGSVMGIGENYYVSMKMVDVVTAQVIAQRTSTTQDGLNDLIQVAFGLADQLVDITESERKDILEEDIEPDAIIEPETKPEVREVKPAEQPKVEDEVGYKGTYFMLATGYGTSYGGLGLRIQFRVGRTVGFGMHFGTGYDSANEMLKLSGGIKLFPFRNVYLNGQFGLIGRERGYYVDYNYIYGPSFMVGGDWNWGRKVGFGFNAGLGVTMPLNARYEGLLPAIDLGFVIRF